MNKIFLSGNLTRDVELYNGTNTAVAKAGIAVNRPFSKDKAVDFFNLVAFGKTAEFMSKYFEKGSRILVEGRLQTSTYEKDGVKHYATNIIVENVEFAGNKKAANSGGKNDLHGEPVDNNDTPF